MAMVSPRRCVAVDRNAIRCGAGHAAAAAIPDTPRTQGSRSGGLGCGSGRGRLTTAASTTVTTRESTRGKERRGGGWWSPDVAFLVGARASGGRSGDDEEGRRRRLSGSAQAAQGGATRGRFYFCVIIMLEHMRSKTMGGYATKEEGAQRDKWQIAPNYQKGLEFEKHLASFCRPICADRGIWQVSMSEFTFIVDLNSRTCGCRKWNVAGIPCCHAMSAIQAFNHKPEEYVDDLFKKEAYLLAYAGQIIPVPDKTQWLQTPFPDVGPPRFNVQPGRPKKKRRKARGERHVPSRSSKRVAIRCSRCKGFGHNVMGAK